MTPQEIFDKVATHLFTQGKQALYNRACMYRGDEGTMCAAGCLIPDEIYKAELEGEGFSYVSDQLKIFKNEVDLITDLQFIHDNTSFYENSKLICFDKAWKTSEMMHEALTYVANKHKLTTDNIKDLRFSDR